MDKTMKMYTDARDKVITAIEGGPLEGNRVYKETLGTYRNFPFEMKLEVFVAMERAVGSKGAVLGPHDGRPTTKGCIDMMINATAMAGDFVENVDSYREVA